MITDIYPRTLDLTMSKHFRTSGIIFFLGVSVCPHFLSSLGARESLNMVHVRGGRVEV